MKQLSIKQLIELLPARANDFCGELTIVKRNSKQTYYCFYEHTIFKTKDKNLKQCLMKMYKMLVEHNVIERKKKNVKKKAKKHVKQQLTNKQKRNRKLKIQNLILKRK